MMHVYIAVCYMQIKKRLSSRTENDLALHWAEMRMIGRMCYDIDVSTQGSNFICKYSTSQNADPWYKTCLLSICVTLMSIHPLV